MYNKQQEMQHMLDTVAVDCEFNLSNVICHAYVLIWSTQCKIPEKWLNAPEAKMLTTARASLSQTSCVILSGGFDKWAKAMTFTITNLSSCCRGRKKKTCKFKGSHPAVLRSCKAVKVQRIGGGKKKIT